MFQKKAKIIFEKMNTKLILEFIVENLINECKGFKDITIEDDNELTGFGMHENGKIKISTSFIVSIMNNYLSYLDEKADKFLELFIEAVIAHEMHHLYIYTFKNNLYIDKKKRAVDNSISYAKQELEVEADSFMKEYMIQRYNRKGEIIGNLLETLRCTPNGERKCGKIKGLINEYKNY